MDFYAGIEAGGTKIKCIIASDPGNVVDETTFATTGPEETLPLVIDHLHQSTKRLKITLKGVGLSCFGPLDLDKQSSTYGWITSTPKVAWRNFPILQYFQDRLEIPILIETDVNGAALGEGRWGAATGISDYVYITVGTGIGGVGKTIIGVLIIRVLEAGLIHLHVPSFWQQVATGLVVIIAVWLDFLQRKAREKA